MQRRTFLTAACGAFLSLPAFGASQSGTRSHKRLLVFVNHLGFYKKHFFPEGPFDSKKLPPLLQPFQNAFGYGLLTIFAARWLQQLYMQIGPQGRGASIIAIFVLLGVLAERHKHI